jgi:elongation factor P
MIDANALRKGVTFKIEKDIFKVVEYSHKKPGRGLATIKVKATNLRTGANIIKTFSSSEKIENINLDYHKAQYLYTDKVSYYFMDIESYDQPSISAEVLGESIQYLVEEMQVKLTFYEGEVLDIELPSSVNLKVTRAETAVRGDTATGLNKKVTVETGLEVNVPAFIETDTVIKVDTRTGEYLSRA